MGRSRSFSRILMVLQINPILLCFICQISMITYPQVVMKNGIEQETNRNSNYAKA